MNCFARAERMARFQSIEELRSDLDLLIGRRPPLVQLIERGPGQREERYAHLLSGPVQATAAAPRRFPARRCRIAPTSKNASRRWSGRSRS